MTNRPLALLIASLCAAVLWPAGSIRLAAAAETYDRVWMDRSGSIHIVTRDGRTIVPLRDAEQVGIKAPLISADGVSVGWLALFPNCCTSYPIPLQLLIYSNGQLHRFIGNGLPIWDWRFYATGKEVAFHQETVHGGGGIHYELRNIATGQLVAQYNPPYGPDNQPLSDTNTNTPRWVQDLDEDQAARPVPVPFWDHVVQTTDLMTRRGARLLLMLLDVTGDERREIFIAPRSLCGNGGCEWSIYSPADKPATVQYFGQAAFAPGGFHFDVGRRLLLHCWHVSAETCTLGEYIFTATTIERRDLGTCNVGEAKCADRLGQITAAQAETQNSPLVSELVTDDVLTGLVWGSSDDRTNSGLVPELDSLIVVSAR